MHQDMTRKLRRGLAALVALFGLLSPLPAAATDFLYDTGTNGFTTAPFNLETTELNSLPNGNNIISSVAHSTGQFTQTDTGGAQFCEIAFVSGGAFTPSAVNPNISGWFVRKADNSNFEKLVTNTPLPRSPDFIIPLFASAYSAGPPPDLALAQGGRVPLPAETFKVLIQNNAGVALPSTGNLVTCGPFAVTNR